MSIDRILYVGFYLGVGEINVKIETAEHGCSSCKTRMGKNDKFCSHCGSPKGEYTRTKKCDHIHQLLVHAFGNGIIDDVMHDDILDNFYFSQDAIYPSDNVVGETYFLSNEMSIPLSDITTDRAAAEEYFKDIIDILRHYDVSCEIEHGISYYLR